MGQDRGRTTGEAGDKGQVLRIIALYKDKIIADGALELSGEEWRRHQGEVRLIVARPFRRKGLGMIMIRELYFLATARNIATIVDTMMRPQKGAQTLFHRLGFPGAALLPAYGRGLTGRTHALLIMVCKLRHMWAELRQ